MSSKSDDPHVGGSLSDMAVTGTKIPNDAGVQNIIPSVARPDQISSTSGRDDDAGARDLAEAADNPSDIPRVCLLHSRFPFPVRKPSAPAKKLTNFLTYLERPKIFDLLIFYFFFFQISTVHEGSSARRRHPDRNGRYPTGGSGEQAAAFL